jgi:hypothetical protein
LAHAGKLADAQHEMRAPVSSASKSRHEGRSSSASAGASSDDDSSDTPWGSALATVFGYIFMAPWMVPHWACEGEGPREFAYERYPYADGAAGALRLGPTVESQFDKPWLDGTSVAPQPTRQIAAEFTSDQSYVLGGLWRSSLAARLQLPLRFELDTVWSLYVEPQPQGADYAWSGAAHVAYRFAQTSNVQFRTGIGYRQWTGSNGAAFGIDTMYGFDVFWGPPLVSSVTLDLGTLGAALVAEARATLGVSLGPVEIFAGYDHVAIQGAVSTVRGGVGLGGPLLGVRAWL